MFIKGFPGELPQNKVNLAHSLNAQPVGILYDCNLILKNYRLQEGYLEDLELQNKTEIYNYIARVK